MDQTIEDTYERVAEALADVEPKDKKTWKEKFSWHLDMGQYLQEELHQMRVQKNINLQPVP